MEIPFPERGSHSAFWEALQREFPAVDLQSHALRLARDQEFLAASDSLRPGDDLAIIPPVSGG